MIVVDSNIICYLLLQSERTKAAVQALQKEPNWAVPFLWRSEVGNVLALYTRKRLLSIETAQDIMKEALGLLNGKEYEVTFSEVLELAAASSCSAYDCEFVALAKDLGVPLVTVDKQLLRQFPEVAISLVKFLA